MKDPNAIVMLIESDFSKLPFERRKKLSKEYKKRYKGIASILEAGVDGHIKIGVPRKNMDKCRKNMDKWVKSNKENRNDKAR